MAPIQMGCINICGINRKFNPLENFLAQDKISILAISETHTVKSMVVSKFTGISGTLKTLISLLMSWPLMKLLLPEMAFLIAETLTSSKHFPSMCG
jgi:hypothetical protein